jgi:bifunctional UDP-N-acetylglucosamine pyrophosphorylase/glucosamine-1-phosphate N-acetyltransferase
MHLAVVILAAGQGTRMKSSLPKVLHKAAGREMLGHVLRAARMLEPERVVVITGHGADQVEARFAGEGVVFARQHEQLGTAHAFLQAQPALEGFSGEIIVLYGDTPMLRPETLRAVLDAHRSSGAGMTVITAVLDNPTGYGRIIRAANGEVLKIVEEKAASLAEKAVKETNSGVYVFSDQAIRLASGISNDNPAHEYYLTDILERYRAVGDRVIAHPVEDWTELLGVNDRVQLAFAEKVLRDRVRNRLMRDGVTLIDPANTYVDDTAVVEPDAVIYPGVFLEGSTHIGRSCVIGPHSRLVNTTLEAGVTIHGLTVLQDSHLGPDSDVGPFARFRPGVRLEREVHIGNFVEVKNSTLGAGTKAGHLAYLGDATIGEEVNIGAGTITANYDGLGKYRTEVGSGSFIGSNSTLIAPRTIGQGAYIAAGSTITDHVPDGDLAVARGKQRNLTGWSERFWRKGLEQVAQTKFAFIRRWLASRGHHTPVGTSEKTAASDD